MLNSNVTNINYKMAQLLKIKFKYCYLNTINLPSIKCKICCIFTDSNMQTSKQNIILKLNYILTNVCETNIYDYN